VVGGIAGGLAGKATAEAIDPTTEDAYWRDNYSKRPYYAKDVKYETYAPAYRQGWESPAKFPDKQFEEVEPDLRRDWEASEHNATLKWAKAKQASRDAWQRVGRSRP
jgi:hypothetical protein